MAAVLLRRNHALDLRQRSALLLWQRSTVLARIKENGAPPLWLRGSRESSRPHFQPNADLSAIVFREMYTGLLKSFLYFEDGWEISFHRSLVLFDPPQSCQADSGLTGKPVLAPA
jgi:hypothetical protein